ncbi:Methionine aminopeptidase [Mesomycoplasma conjunctivae]|uniref:Methionine aminopeptidase n=1 Tax=Mesomycoplasma conjunctivae (strain ATCC 25834 / NCTC 10147 / HRC/581) TaxID=572263 RepID=C5J5V2_MESCH|nr:type I methionyl aminopeptidase [Mesomycoplasma conjunctivae]CAT04841.1 Methionine aminopeptidase [Mesomycoplasma conjunctivae]VEU65898.1 Methionine aminopeptidase [Mesomycoplasma conjunctivae]
MAIIKTNQEVEKLKKSGALLAEVKQIIYDLVRPGISLKELDTIAFSEIKKRNAEPAFLNYHGFPATICASVNEKLIHGIPDDYIIKDGDVVSIDMGLIYQGYYSDSAFTKGVGQITYYDKKIIECTEQAFQAGFEAIKPGAYTGDIGFAIQEVVKKCGFYTPKDFCGHGIGSALHEDPNIFNEGQKAKGLKLKDNMVICIEPMLLQNSPKVKILKDGWSVVGLSGKNSAHFEQTILIKDGVGHILTGEIKK